MTDRILQLNDSLSFVFKKEENTKVEANISHKKLAYSPYFFSFFRDSGLNTELVFPHWGVFRGTESVQPGRSATPKRSCAVRSSISDERELPEMLVG
ncbi:hypothetical protein TNIN_329211 [Trichonephila inaurata madagascariensis]|uniref:Uncharacterized protein n=1 Tax=Trichonephila inaurata madagascariensis TaxID=2747483 RepID=A0A8X6WS51_9ARAC|nr:hypothetical protein TNIN_329211 [Trichonephila inaurata madagascariensis]